MSIKSHLSHNQSVVYPTKKTSSSINWARFNSTFIIEVKRGDKVFTSTAVAIRDNILLTAAHCVDCASDVQVIIGNDYKNPTTKLAVEKCIVHPSYNPSRSFYENDLAVIYLEESLPYFSGTEVITEELNSLLNPESEFQRIGFGGRNNKNIRTWNTLNYKSITFNKKNIIFEDSLSVIGDSGGPIYLEVNGELRLVALHSTLEGANTTYAVNLSAYKNWIVNQLEIKQVSKKIV